jgi:hypothetical protein
VTTVDAACRRCGCEESVHCHYRAGLDCGRCGREKCPEFQAKLYSPRRLAFDTACFLVALAVLWAMLYYLKGSF